MMLRAATIFAALASLWPSAIAADDNDILSSVRTHPRALAPRAGRDCGKFVMFCEKAAGACNNACYHINCVDKSTATMVWDASNSNGRNRMQSGCQTADGSVCNKLPFSQKYHDPLNSSLRDRSVNCDEWPMAATKQSDFKDGKIRNSLRCIPGSENYSGGSQLGSFVRKTNKNGPQRTCPGAIQDGDHWTIEFNTDNVDPDKVKHCNPKTDCVDLSQFYMTKKPNENGKLSFPYDKDGKDNRYTYTGKDDILQCRVVVNSHGYEYEGTVYDIAGKQKGISNGRLEKKGDYFIVKGLTLNLEISMKDGSADLLAFKYGISVFSSRNDLNIFEWDSKQKGVSDQFTSDGRYCKITANGSNENNIECYFAC